MMTIALKKILMLPEALWCKDDSISHSPLRCGATTAQNTDLQITDVLMLQV